MRLRPFTRDSSAAGASRSSADPLSDEPPDGPTEPSSGSGGSHAAPRRPRSWSRPSTWSRGQILLVVIVALVVVLVILGLLLKPLIDARSEAKAAQGDLTAAKAALTAGDFPTASAAITSARHHVDAADSDTQGIGSDFYASMPVFGGAVVDARHLIAALSETTKVAEIGALVYPMVSGDQAQLIQGERINPDVLKSVVTLAIGIRPHLNLAIKDLHQVGGTTPLVGGSVANARGAALAQLLPVRDSFSTTAPLLKSLPTLLGNHGARTYLLAMLNPAELRYSGGAALTVEPVTFDNGYTIFGGSLNVDSILTKGNTLRWNPVPGNPFHKPGPLRLTSSTFSPYWSVSGEELLRAYQAAYQQRLNGVVVVDVQALASMFAVTGPVDVGIKGVPLLSSDNLVKVLAGSYDEYPTALRHRLNAALVSAFSPRLFDSGSSITKKIQVLLDAAKGRHFATYFRDPLIQKRFASSGLSGNLSATPHDYLGVFSQNTNGSKVDYWQHRTITSQVHLHRNGSATVHLRIKVKNQAPAYTGVPPDPGSGYATSMLGAALGVFLPRGTHLTQASVNQRVLPTTLTVPHVRTVYDRPFFSRIMRVPDGRTRVVRLTYRVPQALAKTKTGMSYALDVDPQDTVVHQKLNVEVTWPRGYAPPALPPGWSSTTATTAAYSGHVAESLSFKIPLTGS